jgi:A/G-specific adenine glycosylase
MVTLPCGAMTAGDRAMIQVMPALRDAKLPDTTPDRSSGTVIGALSRDHVPTDSASPDAGDRAGATEVLPDGTVAEVIAWFDDHARDLPWRRPEAGAWGVMVSEFMLQQTPVSRVLPVYEKWLRRWPSPAELAAETSGEAVRAWGRLGYPRRALRLHGAASAIVARHGGVVPESYEALVALPGVGDYTAAAITSFAYGRRRAVLDTNVRRVLARLALGVEFPAAAVTAAERRLAEAVLPVDAATAARWAAASMELGALVCTARTPNCAECPVARRCRWRLAGSPPHAGPPRRGQTYAGTDRQVRGRLLALLRETHGPVGASVLETAWSDAVQRERALRGLISDGLVVRLAPDVFALPS